MYNALRDKSKAKKCKWTGLYPSNTNSWSYSTWWYCNYWLYSLHCSWWCCCCCWCCCLWCRGWSSW